MQTNYLEKVYAGLLGMNIGIRIGAPVEPTIWTYERIRDTYGEITDYIKQYKNFAADDDVNGPFYFLRALYDKPAERELQPDDVADAWLNYAREGVGMFWWGGYGRSTEHTAYLNLKAGIPAPQSGSVEQNGRILAEQIGGQIFIDTWGLVCPGDPSRAADYGQIAASVSHDGEGLYGARFFCAAIARAFDTNDINDIIETALSQIPEESIYAGVARAVVEFYKENPSDWRACREMLGREWGYDKYSGVCHIIPNAGVCVLSMLYGGGDFGRTVEIATMCGWDTDCNAGNVGTVLGVACGLGGIPEKYREPIGDFIALSGISGYLNILDLPTYAKEVALLGFNLAGEPAPDISFHPEAICFDFELPGSTHGLRVSDPFFCSLRHSTEKGKGSAKLLLDRLSRGDQCKVFYKPFYTRNDFSDERYSPVFSPKVYSGQIFTCKLLFDRMEGWTPPLAAPYIRFGQREIIGGFVALEPDSWIELSFDIPDTDGEFINEIGFVIEGSSPAKAKTLGFVYVDDFRVEGRARYGISMDRQKIEFGTVTPFSTDHGAWGLADGCLTLMRCEPSFAYAGNYYTKDISLTVPVTPVNGDSHLLIIRAKGALWGYAAGLTGDNTVTLYRNDHGYKPIQTVPFKWEIGETYVFNFTARGSMLTLNIGGQTILSCEDDSFEYGMYGCGSLTIGRTKFGDFKIEEL